jgi:hypothetical protein
MSYDNNTFIDGKKLIKKILKIDRFGFSGEEVKLVLDARGPVIFMNDVISLIEKELKEIK